VGYPSFASICLFAAIATAFGPAPITSSVDVDAVACSSNVSVGADYVLFASWMTLPSLSITVLQ
jgi:Mn2+/Fe2+ NRAMP family transporter